MKCPHAVSQTTVRDLDDVLLQKRLKPGCSSKLCCSFWCGREELYLYTSFCWHVKRKMNVRCSSDAASLMETVQCCYGVATNWKMWWALLLPAVWTQEDNHMLLTLCDCSWRGVFIKLIKMTCFLCFVLFFTEVHICVYVCLRWRDWYLLKEEALHLDSLFLHLSVEHFAVRHQASVRWGFI